MLSFFQPRPDPHLKKVAEYLREAHMARIEHQAAAEHHAALARMYTERAARLEDELRQAFPSLSRSQAAPETGKLLDAEDAVSVPARPRLSSL